MKEQGAKIIAKHRLSSGELGILMLIGTMLIGGMIAGHGVMRAAQVERVAMLYSSHQ